MRLESPGSGPLSPPTIGGPSTSVPPATHEVNGSYNSGVLLSIILKTPLATYLLKMGGCAVGLEFRHAGVLLVQQELARLWSEAQSRRAVGQVHNVARLAPRGHGHFPEKVGGLALVPRLDDVLHGQANHMGFLQLGVIPQVACPAKRGVMRET